MKMKVIVLCVMIGIMITACSALPLGATPTLEPDPCCISTPSGPLKFEPDSLPSAQVSVKYEAEIHITQNNTPTGDISVLNGTLPTGLELVKVEGEDIAKISGIPTETGTFKFTVSAWCYGTMVSGQSGEKEYEIVVKN
ncbi:MAG: putative Ig domain-containing protein [Anaerolineales bacterium]